MKQTWEERKQMDNEHAGSWLLQKFSYLKPVGNRYSGGVQAAKNIRIDLKRNFPGVKFSVRADYSAVNILWNNGPTKRAVNQVVEKYRSGHFDGMVDSYEYEYSEFNNIFGSVEYVFTTRGVSREIEERVLSQICERYGYSQMSWEDASRFHTGTDWLTSMVYRVLQDTDLTKV